MDNFWSNNVATNSGIDSFAVEPVDDWGNDGEGVVVCSLIMNDGWEEISVDGGGDDDDEAVAGAGGPVTFADGLVLLRLRGWYYEDNQWSFLGKARQNVTL